MISLQHFLYGQNIDLGKQKYLCDDRILLYGFVENNKQNDLKESKPGPTTYKEALDKLRKMRYKDIIDSNQKPLFPSLDPINILDAKVQGLEKSGDIKQDRSNFKNKLSQYTQKVFTYNNSVRVEGFATNYQVPYSRNETHYVRIYADPELSLFSLPFQASFFYTTEDNSWYNSNSFSLRFDPQKFRETIEEQGKKKIKNGYEDFSNISNEKERLATYMEDIKRLKRYNESVLQGKEKELRKQLDHVKDIEQHKGRYEKEISIPFDTSTVRYKDSLKAVTDSAYLLLQKSKNEYELYRKKVERLKRYLSVADSIKKIYDLRMLDYTDHFKKPEKPDLSLQSKAKDSVKSTIFNNPFIRSIRDFEIGLFNPYYSESSINGIAMKGLNMMQEYEGSGMYYRFSVGWGQRDFMHDISENNGPDFRRNIIASKVGFGTEYGNTLYYIHAHIWDPNLVLNEQVGRRESLLINSLNGIGFSKSYDKINSGGELLVSTLDKRSNPYLNAVLGQNKYKLTDNISLTSNLEYQFIKNAGIRFKLDHKSPNFRSLGSPFLQNDYRAMEVKIKYRTVNNLFFLSAFYKKLHHNLSAKDISQNTFKGFGVSGQTNFKQYPNIQLSYSPFEQSNNHADSLLRTNNKFRSLNALITYQKSYKSHYFYWTAGVNQAIVEYRELRNTQSKTTLYSIYQVYQNQYIRSSMGYTYSLTNPDIDTLTFYALNGSVSYNKKSFSVGATIIFKSTRSGGLYTMNSVFVEKKFFSSLRIKLTGGIGKIDQIWGAKEQTIYQGMLSLVHVLK